MEINQGRALRVQLLNGCELGVEGEPPLSVHKKPTKGEKLIARLVLKRGEIATAEELLEIAGLERDERSLQSLKVHIHRLRRRLNEIAPELADCVMTWRRGYAWNVDRCTVDLFESERVCKRVLATTKISAVKMEDVEELVRMFDRKLLPAFAEEGWVEQEAVAFRMLYTDAMTKILTLMWQVEAYELVIRTCHLGMVYAPYWYEESAPGVSYFAQPGTIEVRGIVTLLPKVTGSYTVSFNLMSGTPLIPPQSVVEDGFATEPANPRRPGYGFKHWSLTQPTQAVPEPGKFVFTTTPIKGDITLYAVWGDPEQIGFTIA